MKKLLSLLLCLLLAIPCEAWADETFQFNQRYNLVSAGPFFFVAPEGFASEDGETYSCGGEFFTVNVMEEPAWADFAKTYADDPAGAFDFLDGFCAGAVGESWFGAMRKEKSGGCWKISGLVDIDGGRAYLIVGASVCGSVVIFAYPGDTASGCDLEHGIFKTLSCVEYPIQ